MLKLMHLHQLSFLKNPLPAERYVTTKTAVQIRSHAQKWLSKLERERQQVSEGKAPSSRSLPLDLEVPPPRTKRKSGSVSTASLSDTADASDGPPAKSLQRSSAAHKSDQGMYVNTNANLGMHQPDLWQGSPRTWLSMEHYHGTQQACQQKRNTNCDGNNNSAERQRQVVQAAANAAAIAAAQMCRNTLGTAAEAGNVNSMEELQRHVIDQAVSNAVTNFGKGNLSSVTAAPEVSLSTGAMHVCAEYAQAKPEPADEQDEHASALSHHCEGRSEQGCILEGQGANTACYTVGLAHREPSQDRNNSFMDEERSAIRCQRSDSGQCYARIFHSPEAHQQAWKSWRTGQNAAASAGLNTDSELWHFLQGAKGASAPILNAGSNEGADKCYKVENVGVTANEPAARNGPALSLQELMNKYSGRATQPEAVTPDPYGDTGARSRDVQTSTGATDRPARTDAARTIGGRASAFRPYSA